MKNDICALFLFALVFEISVEIFGQYYRYPLSYQYYYPLPYIVPNYLKYNIQNGEKISYVKTGGKNPRTNNQPLPKKNNSITKRIRYNSPKDKKFILSDFKPGNIVDYEYEYDILPKDTESEMETIIYPVKLINGRYNFSKISSEITNDTKHNQGTTKMPDEDSVANIEMSSTPKPLILITTTEIVQIETENSKEDDIDIKQESEIENENIDYEKQNEDKADENDEGEKDEDNDEQYSDNLKTDDDDYEENKLDEDNDYNEVGNREDDE